MKLWSGIMLVLLLTAMPVFSACDFNAGETAQQKAYREALEVYQEQMQDYRERKQAYQEELNKGYQEYEKALQDWYEEQNRQLEDLAQQEAPVQQ